MLSDMHEDTITNDMILTVGRYSTPQDTSTLGAAGAGLLRFAVEQDVVLHALQAVLLVLHVVPGYLREQLTEQKGQRMSKSRLPRKLTAKVSQKLQYPQNSLKMTG